ncbi:hypothetical protein VTO73DRAFT_4010 [Trametes versicolor]
MFDQVARYVRKKLSLSYQVRDRLQASAAAPSPEQQLDVLSVETHAPLPTNTSHTIQAAVIEDSKKNTAQPDTYHSRDLPALQREVSRYSTGESNTVVGSFVLGGTGNRFASINTLPDELLVHILLLTRVWPPWWRKKINPVRYMQVCRRWRTVILEHGRFWDTTVVKKQTERFLLTLPRSHQVTLNLTFEDLPTLASVLSHVVPLRDRIQSLVLGQGSREELAALSSLFDGAFPSLTKLVIKDHGIRRFFTARVADRMLFLPANYPRLASLKLERLSVQLTGSLFHHLTTLTLDHCSSGPSPMTGDAFFDMLESAEHLESLTLDTYMSRACSQLPSPSHHSFLLPRLRKLDLTDSTTWVRQFTTIVDLPLYGCVRLLGTLGSHELGDALIDHWKILLPLRLHGMPFLQTADTLSITQQFGQEVFHCSGGLLDVMLTLTPSAVADWSHTLILPTAALAAMAELCSSHSVLKSLILGIDLQDVPRAVFDDLFDALPHLISLRMTPPTRFSQDRGKHSLGPHLLASLAAVSDYDHDAGTRVRARCPALARLTLAGFSWSGGAMMSALVACLRARGALGARQLQRLGVAVGPRRRGAGWRDGRYAAQLRKLVSREYKFKVRADASYFY